MRCGCGRRSSLCDETKIPKAGRAALSERAGRLLQQTPGALGERRPTLALNMRSLSELNSLDRDAFIATIGPMFEHSPWIAEATWPKRPFADVAALHHALCDTVREAALEKQLALIRAHPDLADRITLTRESAGE